LQRRARLLKLVALSMLEKLPSETRRSRWNNVESKKFITMQ
jgi:hypothetical protein